MTATNTSKRHAASNPDSEPDQKTQQEYVEAWMRDDDISRRERLHHIEYDC